MLLFITIETVEFIALISSYFYLRSTTNDWPPGDMAYPQLPLPLLATLLMLASLIPTYFADEAIKKDNRRGLIINLIISMVLELAFILILSFHLLLLEYKWFVNSYSSAYWVLVGTHLIFTGIMIFENLYILIQAVRGFYNSERHWGVEVDSLSSYFVVAMWIAVFLTVYVSPYLLH